MGNGFKKHYSCNSFISAVIVLYGLFFAPSSEQLSKSNKIQQNEIVENNDIPSLEDKVEVKTISRQEALNSSEK